MITIAVLIFLCERSASDDNEELKQKETKEDEMVW